jgi:fatty acid desaturase
MEWPTLILAIVIYAGWIMLTWWAGRLPPWIVAFLGGWLIAWHGSLQHETIHGHPTASGQVNRLIGFAPLCLWLPYDRYETLHRRHHAAEHLTFPVVDPESRYLPVGSGPVRQAIARLNSTLAGRLLLGPPIEVIGFLASEARALRAGEPGVARIWAVHLLGVAAILAWLVLACRLSLVEYGLLFVYPGCALSLLRSFAEHRAHDDPARRIAVVDRAPVLGLLFLNNNLHVVHHAFPEAPWWRLPKLYAAHRVGLLQENGGLRYRGYGEVFRRFFLRAHDQVEHPASSTATAGLEGSAG